MKTALVLSGGGARGAYEAGVLRYIAQELAPRLSAPPDLKIVCGASVGALNGSWYAAHGWDAERANDLTRLWRDLRTDRVFRFDARDLLRSPALLFQRIQSRARQAALFDASPFHELIREFFPWVALGRRLNAGALDALSISATEVATGRHVQFVYGRDEDGFIPDPSASLLRTPLRAEHCLASAAIPFLFPAVELDGRWYVDGSLRQNTPLTPALRLGADRVLIVGVRGPMQVATERALATAPSDLSLAYLAGRALEALSVDLVERNLHQLQQLNALLDWGEQEYGADFISRLNGFIRPLRGADYRKVRPLMIQPSEDLGRVASSQYRAIQGRLGRPTRLLLSTLTDEDPDGDADLLSYLLFDGAYTGELERLGWEDARDREQTIADFFDLPPGSFPLDNPWA